MKKGSEGFKPENLLPVDIPATWKAMEKLYDSGKVRAIGVSNFSTKKLGDLLDISRVPPAVNQVECHPSWKQTKLRDFCKAKGVHLSVSVFIVWISTFCFLLYEYLGVNQSVLDYKFHTSCYETTIKVNKICLVSHSINLLYTLLHCVTEIIWIILYFTFSPSQAETAKYLIITNFRQHTHIQTVTTTCFYISSSSVSK